MPIKKLILATFVCVSSVTSFAQASGRIITHHTTVNSMVWSEVEDKYMYFPKAARHVEHNLIESNINNTGSGKILITNVESEDHYDFMVHEADYSQAAEGIVRLECIEVATSTRCTILIQAREGGRMVTVFMPDEQLVVFYDNLQE
jgi:hypothetical protein